MEMLNIRLTEPAKKGCSCDLKAKTETAWKTLLDGAAAGGYGFGWMNLPEQDITSLKEMGKKLSTFEYIVLIGIGGSALGTQMLINAFLEPCYPYGEKGKIPAMFVADNADATTNEAIWAQIDPKTTAVLVVSKSGRTLETLSNFLFFRAKMYEAIGDAAEAQIFAVTDPDKGFLRNYCNKFNTLSDVIPGNTGGRYSVFTSCGLVAAIALGIDADALLAGAGAMKKKLLSGDLTENAASVLAQEIMASEAVGRKVTVFWSYGDKLKSVSEWFAQLWGESLGKDGKGLTPQSALGSIDQHSQLQLYTSGPDDKFFFFLNEKCGEKLKLTVPEGELFDEARYLEGMPQEYVLACERRGVAASLKRRGLPVCEIELDKVDEYCIGGLVMLLETVTALVGFMLEIDPFDQPGVEEGKNYALALCGNANYAKYLDILNDIESKAVSKDFSICE